MIYFFTVRYKHEIFFIGIPRKDKFISLPAMVSYDVTYFCSVWSASCRKYKVTVTSRRVHFAIGQCSVLYVRDASSVSA
jgi:hypothetical protein